MNRKHTWTTVAAVAVLALSAAPTMAQDEATPDEMADDATIAVTGVEYAFSGLPDEVAAGTTITFANEGEEFHELILVRIADEATESLEELLAMEAEGRDPIAEGIVEIIGDGPIFADPGETAEGTLVVDREGRYAALCFIPQGFVPEVLMDLGVTEDMPEEDWPPEAQAILSNPPHLAAGMLQEFRVVPAEDDQAEA